MSHPARVCEVVLFRSGFKPYPLNNCRLVRLASYQLNHQNVIVPHGEEKQVLESVVFDLSDEIFVFLRSQNHTHAERQAKLVILSRIVKEQKAFFGRRKQPWLLSVHQKPRNAAVRVVQRVQGRQCTEAVNFDTRILVVACVEEAALLVYLERFDAGMVLKTRDGGH